MTVQCCPLSSGEESDVEFYSQRVVTARKAHKCGECRDTIAVGARHEVATGKWDGSISTYRTCLSCVEIRDHFACNGWVFGQLWEDIEENFFPDMKAGGPCMAGLSPEAKARLFELRLAWLEKQ